MPELSSTSHTCLSTATRDDGVQMGIHVPGPSGIAGGGRAGSGQDPSSQLRSPAPGDGSVEVVGKCRRGGTGAVSLEAGTPTSTQKRGTQ